MQRPLHLSRLLLALSAVIAVGCAESPGGESVDRTSPFTGALTISRLTCELQSTPLAIDSPAPRLSWVLTSNERAQHQTAYHVLVAASPQTLAENRGDLWDSGKVTSVQSLNVEYAGRPLISGQACYWKVRVWDLAGQPTGWSPRTTWEVALLKSSDWAAAWLNDGKTNPSTEANVFTPDPAPLFRKEFSLAKPIKRARLHISGLGYYEASLNGRRVGDHVLDPGWTAYDHRVLYSTYDVTDQVRSGANCIGVTLGNGWYNPLPLRMWGRLDLRESLPVGRPRFIARLSLDYADGTSEVVVSDQSWKVGDGPIRFNNIYLGEIYDARLERAGWDSPGFDDSSWRKSAIATEPVGPLQPQAQPPIRITEHIPTLRVTEPKPGVFIYDMGQNFSGWATLRIEKPLLAPGTTINLRYGELLNADGTLNPMTSVAGQIKGTRKNAAGADESVGGPGAPPIAWQRDTYITRGTPSTDDGTEIWTPRFTFHAFRYVEVTGLPAGSHAGRVSITGLRLNSDVADAGTFECSNELFNQIQLMCRRTFLANIFGVQSDCPHRERFGYGGDINATSEAFTLNFDMSGFYAKAARDFADAARPDGLFTDTAPFVGIQYCGVGWAMAHPLLLTQLRREYGDERLMAEQYDASRKWLLKVAHDYPGGLITDGLSDHETLEESPVPQMVTPLWVQSTEMLGAMARVLHKDQDAAEFDALALAARAAYSKAFPPTTAKSTQASLAFALYSGLVPQRDRGAVIDALIANLQGKRQGHLTTGILGTKYMLDELSRAGHADVAYALVNRRDFPGWGWMLENGATTLWEHWELSDNTYSHSHPMFGSVSQWFFNWLGGIQPARDAVGYDAIVIRPQMVKGLDWVRSSHRTVRGMIVSNWKREQAGVRMEIEIPVGCTALVHVPAERPEQVSEGGVALLPSARVAGVAFERYEGPTPRTLVYRVASGRYSFVVKP
ncbi:MAG: family 78 glycoside hydrolase catalytic domain [Planctomycetota bacterium]